MFDEMTGRTLATELPGPSRRERGSALVLGLVLIVLATLLGVAVLTSGTSELESARGFADAQAARSCAEDGITEVRWRIDLRQGSDAPPAGSAVTVNDLVDYDAALVYDSLGTLTNEEDDDGDGLVDEWDEIQFGWDWSATLLLVTEEPVLEEPLEVTDTDITNGPPWGAKVVEATVQPSETWQRYSVDDPESSLALTVRFKLDTDTVWGDSENDGPEIVYYDPRLVTNAVEDKNTLIGLGGNADPSDDSPYNITWSDGTDTYPASGTPVLLVEVTGDAWRGSRRTARCQLLAEIKRDFARGLDQGVCGCDSVTLSGNAMVDSYRSSEGDYLTPYDNGNVGTNGDLIVQGGTVVAGDIQAGGAIEFTGNASEVSGDATAGGSITGQRNVGGNEYEYFDPAPHPCPCDVLDVASLVAAAAADNDNADIIKCPANPALSEDESLVADNTIILPGGTYYFHSIRTVGQATIQIGRDTDGDCVVDAPPLKPVLLYMDGDLDLGGGGAANSFAPTDFIIISSAVDPDAINLGGSSEIRCGVYAPNTDVTITGTADFKGAVLGKTVVNQGTGDFHRDEDMADSIIGYGAMSVLAWREVFDY